MADKIHAIEERFKVLCSIGGDLTRYPLSIEDDVEFDTDKDKSWEFAEVFTPLYMVDRMIEQVPMMTMSTSNMDLCSGLGQFSIRILRKLYQKHKGRFNVESYLKSCHYFSELQISSCFKLLWVFSTDINLFIGNSLKLGLLPPNAKGIWYLYEKADVWVNITSIVKSLFSHLFGTKEKSKGKLFVYPEVKEKIFVEAFENIMNAAMSGSDKHLEMLNQILRMKEGRQMMLNFLSSEASHAEQNWQDHSTPEKIVREMLDVVPNIQDIKKILVLFNFEFVECLVKEKGVDPTTIDFGYDSDLEGKAVKAIYGVNTFSIDHCLEVYKKATLEASVKRNGYEIIFSNPPYQIKDEGFGKSARPLYHEIVTYAIDELRPNYICMITPSRWMVGGKGLNEYRSRMLADKRIRVIVDYPGEKEIFTTESIKGGVSYFLWDKTYNGPCEFNGVPRNLNEFDVVIRDIVSCQILRKVLAKTSSFCTNLVLPRKPFGLPTNYDKWVATSTKNAIECMGSGRNIYLVSPKDFVDPSNVLHLYKTLVSKATMEGASFTGTKRQYLMGFNVLNPNQICTETYIVSGTFRTKKEADNYVAYMKTKFYRFMLSLRTITQDINSDKFGWVPDFGDYKNSYSDEYLFEYFGLTKKEIDHINSLIKEIK